ncbi:MAG: tRNA (adenosine(37)-N6)-dimethylallyltransferase MiaA [Nitrospirota bacterium]|jgi:tRNA dimethylallyltransferase
MKRENRVLLLVGPTGVGKTSASVLLARRLGTEIIGADSMQIYRHMDIGTEKPTPSERKEVPHHMIDIVEPSEEFSVGRYLEAVVPIVERLHGEGRVPVVVGGTGLYVKAMTRGLFAGAGADRALRTGLAREETAALYGRLREVDPEAAKAIDPHDKRRIVRALEVSLLSGERMSRLQESRTAPLPYRFAKVALFRAREELYRMIEERVDGMLRRGLPEEVRRVLQMNPSRTALQAIGYKELAAHLAGEYSLQEAVRLIKRNTRRYAKRQLTWFKGEKGLLWVDVTGLGSGPEVLCRLWPALAMYGIP